MLSPASAQGVHTLDSQIVKMAQKDSTRIKFGKRNVGALPSPPTGKRNIYRDTMTPHYCIRVTPTAKTFFWENTIRGVQKRVTIGRFPEINIDQASEIAYDKARKLIFGIRKHAPFHANRIQRHGSAMYNYAIKQLRWKGENPFSFDFLSEAGRERTERLHPADMPRFMTGLDAVSEGMRVLFLAALYSGRRVGGVRTMRWVDLDFETGIWSLRHTKAGKPQEATLPSALIQILADRQRIVRGPWVFPSPSKSGHVEQIKSAWDRVRIASGLHKLQARDLRRTLASWAQDVSMPMAAVQAQLGHRNIATTARHYTNINQTVQRAALDTTVASMIEAANSSK